MSVWAEIPGQTGAGRVAGFGSGGRAMSETLTKALAFLDAAVAQLDEPTRPVPDHTVVELRRDDTVREIPTTDVAPPRPAA